jgi:elongation of very long chain fatty acids protein 4
MASVVTNDTLSIPADDIFAYRKHPLYVYFLNKGPDPRVLDYPLLGDYKWVTIISLAYLIAIPIGMLIMNNYPANKPKRVVLVHNFILFSTSVYMCIETLRTAHLTLWKDTGFQLWCNNVPDREFTEADHAMAQVLLVHTISKAYEFVDTFIMVARKNYHQISFLHVYHHVITFPMWWAIVRYGPGGDAYFCCFLNSFIHVLMYGYYFFACLGYKSPLKKYLTQMQMMQFCLLIGQGLHNFVRDCYEPRINVIFLLVHPTLLLFLFGTFYASSYKSGKSQGSGGEQVKKALDDVLGIKNKKE